MATGIGAAIRVPFVVSVLFLLISGSSPAYTSRRRGGREGAAANCGEVSSRAECESKPKLCRWCTSDALDDMCFGAAEAWRLPRQVFSCG